MTDLEDIIIVWDFPVPGGPCITMLAPFRTSMTALCWDESASVIRKDSGRAGSSIS
jgi:hypothetical protein